MKNIELQEYLKKFPDDAPVSLIMANPRKRKLYCARDVMCLTDAGQPVFMIDVGEEKDMDAEMIDACEECEREADNLEGQMSIEDYPRVMP